MVGIDLHLPSDEKSPSAARHSIDGLVGYLPEDVLQRFRLAVSELVTNAVMHGGGEGDLCLRIRVADGVIRADVIDRGADFPPGDLQLRPGPEEESGRGLFLVDRTVDRWGFSRADGTQVWFEIDVGKRSEASYSY